ncbi:MAG: hypothetical protein WCT40_03270 [Candidatus Magasanikbacteria bacterium]|jgi:hypothetical protein
MENTFKNMSVAKNTIFLLALAATLFTLGAGCATQNDSNYQTGADNNTTSPTTVTTTADAQTILTERLENLNSNFALNHFIPSTAKFYGQDDWLQFYIAPSTKIDCVGVENANTLGGDLLSSLAGSDLLRSMVSLKIYTSQYIKNLKDQVNLFTQKSYDQNMFAYHVCNLKNGMDIVVGSLWSSTTSPYYIEGKSIVVSEEFYQNSIVLLVNENGTHEIRDIQESTKTATGGETGPCDVALNQDNTISWQCFAGLGQDDKNNSTYGKYANWTLSYDGQVIKTWQTRDNEK